MIAVPDYHLEFNKKFNGNSLPFVLFNLAPITAALGMLDKKIITDLNELSENGVSLLALKASQNQYSKCTGELPSWEDFEEHGSNVWNAVNVNGDSCTHLLLSMMFQGANPWTVWDSKKHHGADSLFSLMCIQNNINVINFLCKHPGYPGIAEIEKRTIEWMGHGNYSYNDHSKSQTLPLLHYLANKGNLQIMDVLLNSGYEPNLKDAEGNTALFYIKEPEVAKYLVDKKASVSVTNNAGLGLVEHWSSGLSTAAKKAELNALVVEQLKESMSIKEMQELQKPSLINEILNGTKTTFLSMFRKGKFKPTVEFKTHNGSLNMLTLALLRNDEKTNMFVRNFDEIGVSWSHVSWPQHPAVSNALISKVVPHAGEFAKAQQILMEKYSNGDDFEQYQHDLMSTYHALGENEIGIKGVFGSMFLALNYEHYKSLSNGQSTFHNNSVPYDFNSFQDRFKFNDSVKNKFTLMDQPNTPDALRAVLTACFKNNGLGSFYAQSYHASHFIKEAINKSEDDPNWARTLPYILRLSIIKRWNEKSWDPMFEKMVQIVDHHAQVYKPEDLDTLKQIGDDPHVSVTPMVSAMQKGLILNEIGTVAENSTPRRKM